MRIISLLPAATEIVCGLGLTDELVAVSHECDWPPAILDKPRATRSHVNSLRSSGDIDAQVRDLLTQGRPLYGLNGALIIQLRPDVIITQAQCDVCAVRHEDVLALVATQAPLVATRVIDLAPNSIADVFADILRVGAALGRTAAARDWIAALKLRVNAVRERGEQPRDRPRVACLEWLDPLMAAGNWMPELVRWAGGAPGLSRAGEHSPTVSWDELAAFNPERVVFMPCGFALERSEREALATLADPRWPQVDANIRGALYAVDANAYFNRPGPRLVESLELLARMIHPQIFPAFDALTPFYRRLPTV